jgi:hypothetical protein
MYFGLYLEKYKPSNSFMMIQFLTLSQRVILFSLFSFTIFSNALFSSPPESKIWYQVEIAGDMSQHMAALEPDEKWEQCRDWVVLAYVHALGLDEKTIFEYLYDFSPLRYDVLLPFSNLQYGESRYLLLKNNEVAAFVPYGSPRKRDYLARIADECRMIEGRKPSNLRVIEYEIDMETYSIRFQYVEDIKPDRLFSEDFGYVEHKISGRNDLNRFLETTHDLVFAQKADGGSILVGGRVYERYEGKPFTIEDLATLYQADRNVGDQYIERLGQRGLVNEYKARKRQLSGALGELTIQDIEQELIYMKAQILQMEIWGYNKESIQAKREETAYVESILEEFKAIDSYDNYVQFFKKKNVVAEGLNVGFSLDPHLKYAEFASGLQRIANGDKEFALQWYNRRERNGDKETIIFQHKRLKDAFTEADTEESDTDILDLLYSKEHSVQSMLFGEDASTESDEPEDREEWINTLAGYFDVSEEMLQDETDEIFEKTWNVAQAYKQILLDITRQIESGKTEAQRLGIYYQIRRYIEDDMLIRLDQKNKNLIGEDADETYVNKLIFRDAVDILYALGFLPDADKTTFDQEMTKAVLGFQEMIDIPLTGAVDNLTMQFLLKYGPQKAEDLNRFSHFLRSYYIANSYQKARYDGDLQGTGVGMTLFYTDLVMKLWSFDYKNSSPVNHVSGFIPETEYPISLAHKLDYDKNSSTRSWLGPLQSGYAFFGDGNEVCFSHCATTIYNASSSDLFPGVEREANLSSARFANWWNNHYSEVANFEPEFHRLNQIMKWSLMTHWLKMDSRFGWLSQEPNIRRNLNFESWYPGNSTLKTMVAIPFLDRNALKEKTECLDLLRSKPFSAFREEFLVYSFSGGVSLLTRKQVADKIKVRKVSAGLNRKEVDYLAPVKNDEFFLNNGAKFKLNPSNKTIHISAKEASQFRGPDGEVFGLKLERKISAQPTKVSVVQKSDDIFLGEVSATSQPNKVMLSVKESDLASYRRYLAETAQTNGAESGIFNSEKVELALFLPAEKNYIVKLHGSNNYLRLGKEPVPVGPYNPQSQKQLPYQLRYAAGEEQYLTGAILKDREAAQIMQEYPWKKATTGFSGRRIELTNRPPAKTDDNVVFFFRRDMSAEAIFQKDAFFLKHHSPETDNAIINFLDEVGVGFFSKLDKGNAEGFIFTKSGDRIAFSRRQTSEIMKEIDDLASTPNTNIRAILTSENATSIRFRGNGTLEIPPVAKLSPEQKEVVRFVNERTARNKEWLEVFGNREITPSDVTQLSKIAEENATLAKGYYNAKSLQTLPDGMAFADLRPSGKEMQFVLKSGNTDPQIINVGKTSGAPIESNSAKINQFYRGETDLTYTELMELTRPIADMQREAVRLSGARKIVTVEFDGVNSEVVNKLHNVDPNVQFFKDQPDLVRSAHNAERETQVEYEGAVFLSTADLSSGGIEEISRIHNQILELGIPYESNLTTHNLIDILEDSSYQQIVLVVRATDRGVVMADRTLSFLELEMALADMPEKELLYLITNRRDALESLFAENGKFQRIISNQFQLKEIESFIGSLENVLYFYNGFAGDNCRLTLKEYKKLLKQNPGAEALLDKQVSMEDKKSVIVKVGKLGRQEKKNLSSGVWAFLGQKMGLGRAYKPKTIDNIIDNRQRMKIEQMKVDPKPLNILKSIPTWKVWAGQINSRNIC